MFIARKNFRVRAHEIAAGERVVRDDPGAVFHHLSLRGGAGVFCTFRLTRKYSGHVPTVRQWLADRRPPAPVPAPVAA